MYLFIYLQDSPVCLQTIRTKEQYKKSDNYIGQMAGTIGGTFVRKIVYNSVNKIVLIVALQC